MSGTLGGTRCELCGRPIRKNASCVQTTTGLRHYTCQERALDEALSIATEADA